MIKELLNNAFEKKAIDQQSLKDLIQDLKISTKHKTVLENLTKIPYGETVSYSDFAKKCGFEKEARSIATLIGKNPLPIIIPCHRVVLKSGQIGEFFFGSDVKKELLEFEKGGEISNKTRAIILNFFKL